GEGAHEVAIFLFRRVPPTIHRVEEDVSAITDADLGVWKLERESRHAADIGHDDIARAGEIDARVIIGGRIAVFVPVIVTGALMMGVGFLFAEQKCCVYTPIERQLRYFGSSRNCRRRIPGNRWTDALEAALASGCERMNVEALPDTIFLRI